MNLKKSWSLFLPKGTHMQKIEVETQFFCLVQPNPHSLSQFRLNLNISCFFFFLVVYLLLCLHSPGVQRWYKDAPRPIETQRFLWVPLFGLFQGNINKSRQGRRTPLPAFPVLIQKTSVHVEAIFCQLGKAHKTGFLTKYILILISVQLKLETSPSLTAKHYKWSRNLFCLCLLAH